MLARRATIAKIRLADVPIRMASGERGCGPIDESRTAMRGLSIRCQYGEGRSKEQERTMLAYIAGSKGQRYQRKSRWRCICRKNSRGRIEEERKPSHPGTNLYLAHFLDFDRHLSICADQVSWYLCEPCAFQYDCRRAWWSLLDDPRAADDDGGDHRHGSNQAEGLELRHAGKGKHLRQYREPRDVAYQIAKADHTACPRTRL